MISGTVVTRMPVTTEVGTMMVVMIGTRRMRTSPVARAPGHRLPSQSQGLPAAAAAEEVAMIPAALPVAAMPLLVEAGQQDVGSAAGRTLRSGRADERLSR